MGFRNSVQDVMTRGYKDISVSKIRVNPVNFYAENADEEIYVDQMADLIEEWGQDVNAVVYLDDSQDDGKTYTLLSGERRFKAISKLFDQNQGDGMIHVKIVDKPESMDSEMLQIITKNANRNKSKEVREHEVQILSEIWQHMVDENRAPKGRFVEWAATQIGVSPRTVTNYLKSSKTKQSESHEDSLSSEEKEEEIQVEDLKEYEELLQERFNHPVKISKSSKTKQSESHEDSLSSEEKEEEIQVEDLKEYEELLQERFNHPVKISAKNKMIQIKFKSIDELLEFIDSEI